MKKDKIIISLCVIFSALIELAVFYGTLFIERMAVQGLLISAVFVVVLLLIYGLILPKIFAKFSINRHFVFKVFLIFNIVFNIFSGVIGIYTYLYFVQINPDVMFLNLIVDCLSQHFGQHIDMLWNISYYGLLIAVTFAKPLLLKCSLRFIEKRN